MALPEILFLMLLLLAVWAPLSERVRRPAQRWLRAAPARIWWMPPALTLVFLAASVTAGQVNWELVAIVFPSKSRRAPAAWSRNTHRGSCTAWLTGSRFSSLWRSSSASGRLPG